MNKNTYNYIFGELFALAPLPVNIDNAFNMQIKSEDGKSTKWLRINGEQFKAIERILLGE